MPGDDLDGLNGKGLDLAHDVRGGGLQPLPLPFAPRACGPPFAGTARR